MGIGNIHSSQLSTGPRLSHDDETRHYHESIQIRETYNLVKASPQRRQVKFDSSRSTPMRVILALAFLAALTHAQVQITELTTSSIAWSTSSDPLLYDLTFQVDITTTGGSLDQVTNGEMTGTVLYEHLKLPIHSNKTRLQDRIPSLHFPSPSNSHNSTPLYSNRLFSLGFMLK